MTPHWDESTLKDTYFYQQMSYMWLPTISKAQDISDIFFEMDMTNESEF
jgi:hypothetical protein